MNEELRQLFSAFLDGEVSAEQRAQIEKLLAQNAAARQEMEALRAWKEQINASAPASIAAPPEFRQKIMARLKDTPAGPSPSGTGTGGLNFLGNSGWIAGLTLLGLVGALAYIDHRNHLDNLRIQQSGQGLGVNAGLVAQSAEKDLFNAPGPAGTKAPTVSPADIQPAGAGPGSAAAKSASVPLDREVYQVGHGRAGTKAGSPAGSAGAKSRNAQPLEEMRLEKKAGSRLEAEGKWDLQAVNPVYLRLAGSSPAWSAERILEVSAQNRFHPGLLMAAVISKKTNDLPRVARLIREALDATPGQSETARLRTIIRQLKGKKTWLARWQKILNALDKSKNH